MPCPPNITFFRFQGNELDQSELTEFISHVSSCENCHYKLMFLNRVKNFISSIPENSETQDKTVCLSDDQINVFVENRLTAAERQRLLGHILNCEQCLRRVVLVFEVLDHLQEETLPVPEDIWLRAKELGSLQREDSKRYRSSHLLFKANYLLQNFFPFSSRSQTVHIIFAICAVILILILSYAPYSFFHRQKTSQNFMIKALAPRAEIVSLLPEFRWKSIQPMKKFCVYLRCNDSSQLIWQETTTGTCLHFPPDASIKLQCKQSYNWYVEGTLATGEKSISNTVHFSINPIFPD